MFLQDVNIKTSPDSGKAIFNSLPTISFAYQCHVSGVPVYCSLKERNLKTWLIILSLATLMSSIFYSTVTIFGYLTFGDQIKDDILLNYSDSSIPMVIGTHSNPFYAFYSRVLINTFSARIGVMISVMMSYPVIHYCGRVCLEDVYRKIVGLSNHDGNRTWTRRYYIQTVTWFALSLLGALFIPGIGKVVNLIGAFAAFFILGFPGICIFRYGQITGDYITRPGRLNEEDTNLVLNMAPTSEESKPSVVRNANLCMLLGSVYLVLCAFLFGEAFTSGIIELF